MVYGWREFKVLAISGYPIVLMEKKKHSKNVDILFSLYNRSRITCIRNAHSQKIGNSSNRDNVKVFGSK